MKEDMSMAINFEVTENFMKRMPDGSEKPLTTDEFLQALKMQAHLSPLGPAILQLAIRLRSVLRDAEEMGDAIIDSRDYRPGL